MTDQVDVGWAAPPFGLKELEAGTIRVVAKATDAAIVRGQTIRVLVANADALAKKKAVIERFMQAYRESIDYMYSDNPQVIKDYAEFVGIPESLAKRTRDEFFPKKNLKFTRVSGLDEAMADLDRDAFGGAPPDLAAPPGAAAPAEAPVAPAPRRP